MVNVSERVEISKEVEFDAGHRVLRHNGKCRHPHGHRYLIRATCAGSIIRDPARADHGMLVDFGDLKEILTAWTDRFDHQFILESGDPLMIPMLSIDPGGVIEVDFTPTAENLAVAAFTDIAPILDALYGGDLELIEIEIRETPTSWARFRGEDLVEGS